CRCWRNNYLDRAEIWCEGLLITALLSHRAWRLGARTVAHTGQRGRRPNDNCVKVERRLLRTRLGNGARKVRFLGFRRENGPFPQAVGLSTRLLLHLFFERRYCRGG